LIFQRNLQQSFTLRAADYGVGNQAKAMQISLYKIIVWLIIGLAGGTLAGLIVKREKRGFGIPANLGVGLAGALIGGGLFRVPGLFSNLDKIAISMRDIVSALVGSLLVLALFWLWQRYGRPR
jgi:uncharacterized membrane protein YeaQ/YmgE (transglycosylase-associated protein family)